MVNRGEGAGLFEVINLSGDLQIFTVLFSQEAVVLKPVSVV
jgi:hypothetical protein